MSRKIQIVLPDPQADQLAELAASARRSSRLCSPKIAEH